MKKKILIILGVIVIVGAAVGFYLYQNSDSPSVGINDSIVNEDGKEGSASTNLDSDKVLVVYFSHGGNTQKLAKEISDQVGGDFRRIEPVNAYPGGNELYDYTEQEQADDARPEIQDLNIDMSKYDIVFIGYPIWWYTYPQVILTFFDNYDLTGKTIVPFVTHGGSGMSGTEDDMREYLSDKDVTVLDGLAVSRNDIEEDQSQTVTNWLEELGFIK
ncbi:MAG TPA: NAD(P)H-dependent oxidoreductase [Candidatus Erysipelatoclostridium merdavium]|uniref:NAD(P)H-dependent oxidoreductase n=1 Tax=Candidatus Erysipelatoclostridium merdavium TaxID=2838566 RepID=A0A9D2BMZ2_9FIRM|nr:NAD(P)H-dependent oxidoreductase [Candidatus Erysipelatoclostridium merdavium]